MPACRALRKPETYCAYGPEALLSNCARLSTGCQLLCRVLLVYNGKPAERQQQHWQNGQCQSREQYRCDEHENQAKDGYNNAAKGHTDAGSSCALHQTGVLHQRSRSVSWLSAYNATSGWDQCLSAFVLLETLHATNAWNHKPAVQSDLVCMLPKQGDKPGVSWTCVWTCFSSLQ